MTTAAFTEGALEVEIADVFAWVRWDQAAAYRQGLQKMTGTKAVEAIVVHDDGDALYLEIKDFRRHRIANKRRLTSGELVAEVAAKVRDSLAGLVWSCGRTFAGEDHTRLVQRLRTATKPLVVLWLEDDVPARPADAATLAAAIRSTLRPWLNARVIVTSTRLEAESRVPLQRIRVANRRP
jgi:hypothetical protein